MIPPFGSRTMKVAVQVNEVELQFGLFIPPEASLNDPLAQRCPTLFKLKKRCITKAEILDTLDEIRDEVLKLNLED